MGRKDGKPRGRMTAYAFFVQTCREEHKKKHPDEQVVFAEFSRKCAEKWKGMTSKDKKRFDDMAAKDKVRYEGEMANYIPPKGAKGGKRKKKDPNAPKRPLSAFFVFCGEERPKVKEANPSYGIGDIAKELGRMWERCPNKEKFEALARADKERYEKANALYKKEGAKRLKTEKVVVQKRVEEDDEDEEDDDDDDEDDEDDDEDDDDDE